MKNPNAIRRILAAAAALVAVGALSFGATGCTSATSASPAAVSQAAPAAPAPASTSAAAPVAVPAAAGPTSADGQRVVQSSCIGRCHQPGLLKKRYSASSAQAIAADMGSKAGLNSGQKAAVVAYFAQ